MRASLVLMLIMQMRHSNFFLISIIFLIVQAFTIPMVFGQSYLKKPNVSGQFYTSDPAELRAQIKKFMDSAEVIPPENPPEIIVAPHAGYMYSGAVAAYSFKSASKKKIKTVVILAPSHFYSFRGVSIWGKGAFVTPLGQVPVAEDFAQELLNADDSFIFEPKAFEKEHSLEVEIPFLQETFEGISIVPVVMGSPDISVLDKFAKELNRLIGEREDVLVVTSTDLSHFHSDQKARQLDKHAIEAIKDFRYEDIYKGCFDQSIEMCGCIPVTTALILAKLRNLTEINVLKYANSGDVSGNKDSVVGYAAISLSKPHSTEEDLNETESSLTDEQKKKLLRIARETMEAYVKNGEKLNFKIDDDRLNELEGAFVTIHKDGQLRGCIGHIIGRQPLCVTVRDMAIASSTQDSRFQPVTEEELNELDLEVSVLSVPREINNVDEIVLGKHGVIVSQGPRNSGVFLPQVADETGWSKEKFMSVLSSQKAGLSPDAWKDPKTKIEIFTADVFSEKDFH